jgi:thioredoxin-related protein
VTVARVLLALALVALALAVSVVLNRRTGRSAPLQVRREIPSQLDRRDFDRPDAPYLVAVFTSATCVTCADIARKAAVLASADVVVQEVEFSARRDLHERYSIDAVPALVVADRSGVVGAAFLGPVTATDLWAAVARMRSPG